MAGIRFRRTEFSSVPESERQTALERREDRYTCKRRRTSAGQEDRTAASVSGDLRVIKLRAIPEMREFRQNR
jgi:hypothetical protein